MEKLTPPAQLPAKGSPETGEPLAPTIVTVALPEASYNGTSARGVPK